MIDIAHCLLRLVPGAQFGIMDNDYGQIEWQSPEPLPSLAECEAIWPTALDEANKEQFNATIQAEMDAADTKAFRMLSEAVRTGDKSRLEAHEVAQSVRRAKLKK